MWNYDENWVNNVMGPQFASRYKQAGRLIGDDPGYAVWPSRCLYDITADGLDPATSLAKHDRELCAALGIVLPFPPAPSRDTLLTGQMTVQGVTIHTDQWGDMPWWPACWAWLTPSDRAKAAAQLLAIGDVITLAQYPDGRPLYDEPGQFYSRDKFPALLWNMNQMAALVEELIGYGFQGVWPFLGGDGDYTEAAAEVAKLGPALTSGTVDLNDYTVVIPCWDSVWGRGYGWSKAQVGQFADACLAVGIKNFGIEHSTGYAVAGDGNADFQPGGVMHKYSLVLGEFDDGVFVGGAVWQILARYLSSAVYIRPPEQPNTGPDADLPPVPYYLQDWNGAYRVFEYYIYGAVRGTLNSTILQAKLKFQSLGAPHVC